ncbi:MAG: hypothetical protein ACKO6N_06630 [Myxococcota bacterium]
MGLLVWPVLLLWALSLIQPVLSNGDAAVYLDQVLRGELSERTVHLGYLVSAAGWLALLDGRVLLERLLERLLVEPGMPHGLSVLALHLHSVFWGMVALGVLGRLERRLSGARWGVLAGLLWLAMPPILKALTTAEVEPMAWALQLGALLLWLEGWPVLAGLVWGAAFTVTPLVVVSLPTFVCLPSSSSETSAGVAYRRLLLGLSVLPGLLLVWHGEDWLWGSRGVLNQPPGMTRLDALERRLGELSEGLGLLLLLCGWILGKKPTLEQQRLLWALGASVGLTFWLDRYRDMPAYGWTAALLALWLACGLHARMRADARERADARVRLRAWGPGLVVGSLMLLALVWSDQQVRAERRQGLAQRELWRAQARWLREQPEQARCVVGSFSASRRFLFDACGHTEPHRCMGLAPSRVLRWAELEQGAGQGLSGACVVLELPERVPPGKLASSSGGGWLYTFGSP